MLPFVFEWQWDWGHLIFMGCFYLALLVLGGTLLCCLFRTCRDLAREDKQGKPARQPADIPKLPPLKQRY